MNGEQGQQAQHYGYGLQGSEPRPIQATPTPYRTWGAELAAALSKAQGKVLSVAKDGKNNFHNYRYASAESLIEEARAALAACGLAALAVGYESRPEEHPVVVNDKGKPMARVIGRLSVDYLLVHESGQYMQIRSSTPIILEAGKPEDKAEATASTYNLGYMLRGLLLLSRGEEGNSPDARDDRDYESGPREAPRQAPPPRDAQAIERFLSQIVDAQSSQELNVIGAKIKAAKLPAADYTHLLGVWNKRYSTFRAPAQANGAAREPGVD